MEQKGRGKNEGEDKTVKIQLKEKKQRIDDHTRWNMSVVKGEGTIVKDTRELTKKKHISL